MSKVERKIGPHDEVRVAVTCVKVKTCPKGEISGDGSCFELEDRKMIVPFESSPDEHISYLNSAERLRNCVLGENRYRILKD